MHRGPMEAGVMLLSSGESCEWESLKLQDRIMEKDQGIPQAWVDLIY